MGLFNQKLRYSSRPLDWLFAKRRPTLSTAERILSQLKQQLDSAGTQKHKGIEATSILLASRRELRWLMTRGASVPVLQRYQNDINPSVRALTIWLLSAHASRFFLFGIENSCEDFSPMVRKHVAKALRRLEAREPLEAMATKNPDDEAILWFANFRPNQKSYHERLAHYTRSVHQAKADLSVGPSRMPLWFRDEYWAGSPPKSIEYMREILQRIRELVRG